MNPSRLSIRLGYGLAIDRLCIPGISVLRCCQKYWLADEFTVGCLRPAYGGEVAISSRLNGLDSVGIHIFNNPLLQVAVRTYPYPILRQWDVKPTSRTMLARLFHAPPEIYRNVAFFAILGTPLGPPRDFYSLSLLCRASYRILADDSAQLYPDTFAQKFDAQVPKLRLGESAFQANAKLELQRRFRALKSFRKGNLGDPQITEDFWIAYLMLEDSDTTQKNIKQLLWAGLPTFLDNFLREHLYDGSEENNGWPLPNERNSLAIALFWLSSSQSSVNREREDSRDEMMRLLRPFVFAAFRYPIFTKPESRFVFLTSDRRPDTAFTVHGPYPPPPLLPQDVAYFGKVVRTAHVPSAPLFASLSYFARHETMTPAMPPHLLDAGRQTREQADALGLAGPTIDDMLHFIHQCRTRFANFPAIDIGIQPRNLDNAPSMILGQPLYRLGTLTGRWQGSYIMPFLGDYQNWLDKLPAPFHFPSTGRFPLYVTLEEHFTRDPKSIIPRDDLEHGAMNAWLPSGCQWVRKPNGIEVSDGNGGYKIFYETFKPGGNSNDDSSVADVIITGKTDDRHAAAWGGFHFLGRIRLSDGLMMMTREALGGTGTELFRGYVTSSQNLIGRLRHLSDGTKPAYWEATFSLCKDHVTV